MKLTKPLLDMCADGVGGFELGSGVSELSFQILPLRSQRVRLAAQQFELALMFLGRLLQRLPGPIDFG